MKKKLGLVLTTSLLISSMLVGCNIEFKGITKSYTYDIETNDKVKVSCETKNGLTLSQDGSSFILTNEDKEDVNGVFLTQDMYEYLIEGIYSAPDDYNVKKDTNNTLVENEKIKVYSFNEDEDEYYSIFWLPDSSTGVKLDCDTKNAEDNIEKALDCITFEVVEKEEKGIDDPAKDIINSLKENDEENDDKENVEDESNEDENIDNNVDVEDENISTNNNIPTNQNGNVFSFVNGEYFISNNSGYTEQKAEKDTYKIYMSADQKNVIELFIIDDYKTSIETLGTQLKDLYGSTPMYTYNEEGAYLTSMTDSALVLAFSTAGVGEYDYLISLSTVDTDNCQNIMYQFVDDLLASGLTVETDRIKYETTTPNTNNNIDTNTTNESVSNGYWTTPSDYSTIYECEYFVSYNNPKYEVTMHYEPDDDLVEYVNGDTDTIFTGIYSQVKMAEETINGQKWYIFEGLSDGGYYYYHAIDSTKTMYMEIDENLGNELTNNELKDIIGSFVK